MNRRTLTSDMVSMMIALLCAAPAAALEEVRKVAFSQPALQVIEEKCLVCHNRQRIDEAVKKQKNMEKILRLMEKKGVVLTETERRVMGHFQSEKPFKGKKEEAAPQEKQGADHFR